MKFLKLSLAASVALGAFSTASFAQPLEEAIRGIDVSGYLRYRYNDDRYNSQGFVHNSRVIGKTSTPAGPGAAPGVLFDVKDSVVKPGSDYNAADGTPQKNPQKNRGNATHRWKAVADFKTPVVNNIGLNLGILYNNESQNVNHGNTYPGLGSGLGSGKDGSFGVSTFYATIAPDSTATTILIGKQRLATPVTNAGDDDRGTGILALNSDITGLTLAAGAFDSWSIDDLDLTRGYTSGNNDGGAVDKPLYALAGIYSTETSFGTIGAQLWGFYIQDAVDALGVGELSWNNSTFNIALQYALAKLDNSDSSILGALHNGSNNYFRALQGARDRRDNVAGAYLNGKGRADISEGNDLFVLNLGADFAQDYGVPLDVKLGYVTNFQDGTAVTLNDDGTIFKYAGAIWWQNQATGISTSALLPTGVGGFGSEQDINVFYLAAGYKMIDDRLRIGLDYVFGSNEITWTKANRAANLKANKFDVDFQEITPRFSWKHNANLTISGYYAYLMTDAPEGTYTDPVSGRRTSFDDEDRQRVRLEVRYDF